MNIENEGILIFSIIVISGFLSYSIFFSDNLEKVKSTVDDQYYLVQNREDSLDAANLIANIRSKLEILVEHLIKTHPADDIRIQMLKQNFKPEKIKEGDEKSGYTSYSINKGEQIVLCLRNKDSLVDMNTMLFVVLHELAHLATESIGHEPEFWENFKWILEESINIGIYTKKDYSKESVEYCGMSISTTPLA
jgi:predicted metal-dependent hydrolase